MTQPVLPSQHLRWDGLAAPPSACQGQSRGCNEGSGPWGVEGACARSADIIRKRGQGEELLCPKAGLFFPAPAAGLIKAPTSPCASSPARAWGLCHGWERGEELPHSSFSRDGASAAALGSTHHHHLGQSVSSDPLTWASLLALGSVHPPKTTLPADFSNQLCVQVVSPHGFVQARTPKWPQNDPKWPQNDNLLAKPSGQALW